MKIGLDGPAPFHTGSQAAVWIVERDFGHEHRMLLDQLGPRSNTFDPGRPRLVGISVEVDAYWQGRSRVSYLMLRNGDFGKHLV